MTRRALLLAVALGAGATPLAARDSLGVFGSWGAFRDPAAGRCYAIAMPRESLARRDYQPFATVGTWPGRGVRGQVHLRLSRAVAVGKPITLRLGPQSFALAGGGGDAWAQDQRMDAAIVAAMRAVGSMTVSATDARAQRFTDSYPLEGAATAIDAASLGCAPRR